MTMTTTTMPTNKMNELLSPNAKSPGRLNPRRRKISVEIKPLKDRIKNLKDATSKTAEIRASDDPTNSPTQMLSPSHKHLSINPTPLKDLIENYKAQASPVKKSKAISPTTPKGGSRRLTKTQIDQMMVMVDEGEAEDDEQEEGEEETEKEKSWEQYALAEENKTLHEKLDALEKRLYDSEKYGHEEHTKAKIRLEELQRIKKERDQAYRELQTHHHHQQESGQETSSDAAHRSEDEEEIVDEGEGEVAATKEDLIFENAMLHEKLDALEKRLYEAEGMYHSERKSAKIQREELKRLKKERDHVIREQKQQQRQQQQQIGEAGDDDEEEDDELVAENQFLNEKLDALEERLYEAEEKYHKEHKTAQVQQEELQRLKREREQLFREQKKQQQIVAVDDDDDDDDDDTTGQQKQQPSITQESADDMAAENQFLNEKLDALEARLYEAEDMYQSEKSKYEVQYQELQKVKKERDELLLHSSRDEQPQQLQQNSSSTSNKDDDGDYCPTESIRYLMETHVLPLFESFAVNNNNDIIQVPNPSDTRKDIENLSQALKDCCSYYHSSSSSSQKSKGGGIDNTNVNPWISTTVKSFQTINRQHYKNLQLLMESKLESSSEKEESSEETESSSVLKQQQQQMEATISDQQLEIQQLKCELDIIKDKNKDAETALAMNRYTIQTLKKNESQLEEETDAEISKLEKENDKLKDALILLKQKFDEQKTGATMTTTDNDGNNNTEKDAQIKKLSEEMAVLEQSFEEEVQALMEANQRLKESKATSQSKLEKQIDDLNRANQENKTKIQHWKDKYKTDTRKLMKMIEKNGSTKK